MFRQLAFGVAVAACLAVCSAEVQAQCVGCGGSTPIYSTSMSSGVVYNAPMYSQQVYSQPVYNQMMPQTYTAGTIARVSYAAPMSNGCCSNSCGNTCGSYRMYNPCRTTCCRRPVSNCCNRMVAPVNNCGGCGNCGVSYGYASNACGGCGATSPCVGCGANQGVIMNGGAMEPQSTGGAVDTTSPPMPVEDKKMEEKGTTPSPATETAGEAK